MSTDGKTACSSCHQPALAFQDGRARAQGALGQLGSRNTPSLLNVGRQETLFWDGRRDSLEAQALDPLLNQREQGLGSRLALLQKLETLPEYKAMLADPAGVGCKPNPASLAESADSASAPTPDAAQTAALSCLTQALAAFESTLADGPSPFDRFYFDGKTSALTEPQQLGWRLFKGRAGCIACHEVGARAPAMFTDHGFHALPLRSRRISADLANLLRRYLAQRQSGRALDEILLSDDDLSELGRYAVTQDPADIGKFKTPSLRNVALTAPYMHDGSVATLEQAVDLEIYYRGTRDGRPLILTPEERQDLVAFLYALTGFDWSSAR